MPECKSERIEAGNNANFAGNNSGLVQFIFNCYTYYNNVRGRIILPCCDFSAVPYSNVRIQVSCERYDTVFGKLIAVRAVTGKVRTALHSVILREVANFALVQEMRWRSYNCAIVTGFEKYA